MKLFKSDKHLRAIVMIALDIEENHAPKRQTPEERKAAIEAVVKSAEKALPDIDRVLEQHGGRRLSSPNALGTVTVEITPKGFKEIDALECVTGVIEDQPVSLID